MKILVIKLGALGDVVMATPLIEAIQQAHPSDQIELLTSPPFAQIFTPWQGLVVHAFERQGLTAMLKAIKFIRGAAYDRIYDLQGNDRTAILCALSKTPIRIGNHTRYPYSHHPPDKWRGNSHIFERMKRVLDSAGVKVTREVPILPVTLDSRNVVEQWLQEHLANKKLVGLHASASALRGNKCWPHFASLATKLAAHGFTPVWLGASNDRINNRALIEKSAGIDASGKFSIPELAYFAESLEFAVANDSGPMHALAAANKPVYGLFGPSDWRRNHALGQADNVICSPAASGDIAAITVNFVWQKLIADQRVTP